MSAPARGSLRIPFPEKEYEECRNKAQAVIQALKCGMDSERKDSRKKGKGR